MPLLNIISPELQDTPDKKAHAIALGRALVKTIYGDKFGDDFTLSGKAEGLQNFNYDIIQGDKKVGFLSIQRAGQGEPDDPQSQAENMHRWQALAKNGMPVPRVYKDTTGKPLPQIPDTITIPEQIIIIDCNPVTVPQEKYKIPDDIKGLTVIAQHAFAGTPITDKNTEAFHQMGILMGKFHKAFENSAITTTLPSPVEIFPRSHDSSAAATASSHSNPPLQQMILKAMGLKGNENIAKVIAQLEAKSGEAHDAVEKIIRQLDAKMTANGGNHQASSLELFRNLRDKIHHENWFKTTLERYQNAVAELKRVKYGELPLTPCHGDFHFGNMAKLDDDDPLKRTGHEYVMFDMMGWQGDAPRIWDMMQPLVINGDMTDGKFDPELAKSYLKGILSQVELTPEEIAAIPTVLHAAHLRSTATRLTSFILSPEVHMVTKSPLELLERMDNGYKTGAWAQRVFDEHQSEKAGAARQIA